MLYNFTAAAAPANVGIRRKPKFIQVYFDKVTADNWSYNKIIRYLTLSDANADTNRNLELDTQERRVEDHEDLTANTTYYYRTQWIDSFGNESLLSAQVNATWQPVLEGDTDDTAPATPSSANLTLSQVQRRDKDGGIHTHLRGVFVTTGYSAKTRYKFNVSDGTNTSAVDSKDGTFEFPAVVGLTYSVTVVAISFADKPSTASSAVTKLTTAKAADIASPAGLTIASSHRRNEVSWTKVNTTTYPDYSETEVYRNTVNTTPTPGTTTPYRTTKANSIVDAALDTTTLYYYWIAHRDNTGNYTAVSSVVSGTGLKILNADVGPDAIKDANIAARDPENKIRNANCDDITLWTTSVGPLVSSGTSQVAESANKIVTAATTGVADINSLIDIPVKAGKDYFVEGLLIASDVATSVSVELSVNWYSMDSAQVTTLLSNTIIGTGTGVITTIKGIATAPSNARRAQFVAKKTSAQNIGAGLIGPVFKKASSTELIPDGDVTEIKADSTAPATPSSANLTLSQVQRRDKDGGIHTHLRGVFNTTGYSANTRFKFNVSDGTNTSSVDSKDGIFEFPAVVGLTYSVTVVAISFSDKPSTASSAVTKLTTAKAADIATPSGLAISSAHKRNEVSWTKVNTNTYPDYAETEVYRNTVNTTPTPGATTPYRTKKGDHIVDAAIDTSTLYYYWIAHKDNSGNYTSVVGPVSGTGAKIIKADVTAGAIGGTELAVTDLSANGENLDLSLGQMGFTTTADIANDPSNAFNGTYVLKRAYTGASASYVNRNLMVFACRPGEKWYIGGMVKKDASLACTNAGWRISWLGATKTEIAISAVPAFASLTTSWQEIAALATVPAGAVFGRAEFAVYSQTAGTAFASHGYARPAVVNGIVVDGAITKAKSDQSTTPSTPSAGTLTLSQGAKDTDAGDGRVSVKVVMTASSLPTNADEIQFEVDFNYPSTPDIHIFTPKKGLKASFDGIVGKQYSINYRGITVFDVQGPLLASAVTITPTAKTSGPADPTTVSITDDLPFHVNPSWDTPTETDYWYTEIALTVGTGTPASIIAAVSAPGTPIFVYKTLGSLWYVQVRHINRSKKASNWVVCSAQYTHRGISQNQIADNAIVTRTIADDQVTNAKLATGAVTTIKIGDGEITASKFASTALNNGISAMSIGGIGTYAMMKYTAATTLTPGDTTNGSNLVYTDTSLTSGTNPSGTWRCMGRCPQNQASMFLRIS